MQNLQACLSLFLNYDRFLPSSDIGPKQRLQALFCNNIPTTNDEEERVGGLLNGGVQGLRCRQRSSVRWFCNGASL
jgi:hypothetical protein